MAESTATGSSAGGAKTAIADSAAAAQEEARRQFESTREALKESGERAYVQARTSMLSAAEEQKRRAADAIGGVARSLHDAARSLTSQQQETTARYTDMAADQLERAASMLHERSVDDLVTEVERFARNQPALFLGGAFAIGFMMARFLKSGESYEAAGYDEATLYGSDDIGVGAAMGGYGTTGSAYGSPAGARPDEDSRGGGGI